MATHLLQIPDWLPVSVNVLMRLHWSARNRLLKADAEMVSAYARQAVVPTARGKRKVTLTFAKTGKLPDADNLLKSALDACVRAGLLIDDSPQWCEAAAACVRGPKRTTIALEDCDERAE